MNKTYRVALIRADGTYQGPGMMTVSGEGKTFACAVEHVGGLGVTKRDNLALDLGDMQPSVAGRLDADLRRTGWKTV